jgi:hypothetical protein
MYMFIPEHKPFSVSPSYIRYNELLARLMKFTGEMFTAAGVIRLIVEVPEKSPMVFRFTLAEHAMDQ